MALSARDLDPAADVRRRPAVSLVPRMVPRLGDYWATVYRRTWRGSVITSFLMPFLYLAAMGVGLGGFVDANAGSEQLGGIDYLDFIAPGLLATTAMMTGVFESTWPVMGGFKWHRTFYSMAASPLRTADIVAGQVAFTAFRIGLCCGVFVAIMTLFGAVGSWWGGLLALAVVVLLGLAYTTPTIALTSRMRDEGGFSLIFRLGLMPMFLFSGAFFPVSQLPDGVAWAAYVTPVWHGVESTRMLTTGAVDGLPIVGHLSYLLLWAGVGWYYSVTGFAKRLER